MNIVLARWKALVDSLLGCAQYLLAQLSPQLHQLVKTKCDKVLVRFASKLIPISSEVHRSSVPALSTLVLVALWFPCGTCCDVAGAGPFASLCIQQCGAGRGERSQDIHAGFSCSAPLWWQLLYNSLDLCEVPEAAAGMGTGSGTLCTEGAAPHPLLLLPAWQFPSHCSRESVHSDLTESITVFEGVIYIFI